jgi:hypothetical protein
MTTFARPKEPPLISLRKQRPRPRANQLNNEIMKPFDSSFPLRVLLVRRGLAAALFFLILIFSTVVSSADGGGEAREETLVCACQPVQYEFILNFQPCRDDQHPPHEGIIEWVCLAQETPIEVLQIEIQELGSNLRVVARSDLRGSFHNGDVFTYTSIIAKQETSTDPSHAPKGLSLTLTGLDVQDRQVLNMYTMVFDSRCDQQLFVEGVVAGWTIIKRLDSGEPHAHCPLSGAT